MPTRAATTQLEELPESSFVSRYRDQIPPPSRTTTALQVWRATATGQAAAANAGTTSRGTGRGRNRGRWRNRGGWIARGRKRKRSRAEWLLLGDEDELPIATAPPPDLEEYQSQEQDTSQHGPGYFSDQN